MGQTVRRAVATGVLALGLGLALVPGASAYDLTVRGCVIKASTSCPGADLSGANLAGAPLSGANLQGANLRGANLREADLSSANLRAADLTHSDMTKANLHKADAERATLHQVLLGEANLSYANLTRVQLFGSQAVSTNFIGANLSDATAHSVNFAFADLGLATLSAGDFTGSHFLGAILGNADFSHATVNNAYFVHAYFHRTNFNGAKIVGADVIPSNIDTDGMARFYFFERVYTHVNAYGSYGNTNSYSSHVSAEGGNDDPNGAAPFSHRVSFQWGAFENRKDVFQMSAYGNTLSGRKNGNLADFYVDKVTGSLLPNVGPTETEAPRGHPGGPIALSVGWHGVFSPGYSINVSGWLPRVAYAPAVGYRG
jgi:uncharacterized protein YjbI with pentapeptide repeats